MSRVDMDNLPEAVKKGFARADAFAKKWTASVKASEARDVIIIMVVVDRKTGATVHLDNVLDLRKESVFRRIFDSVIGSIGSGDAVLSSEIQ